MRCCQRRGQSRPRARSVTRPRQQFQLALQQVLCRIWPLGQPIGMARKDHAKKTRPLASLGGGSQMAALSTKSVMLANHYSWCRGAHSPQSGPEQSNGKLGIFIHPDILGNSTGGEKRRSINPEATAEPGNLVTEGAHVYNRFPRTSGIGADRWRCHTPKA